MSIDLIPERTGFIPKRTKLEPGFVLDKAELKTEFVAQRTELVPNEVVVVVVVVMAGLTIDLLLIAGGAR